MHPSDAERALIARAVQAANTTIRQTSRRARELALMHLLQHSPLNAFQCRVVLCFLPMLRTATLRVGTRALLELGEPLLGTSNAELRLMLRAPLEKRKDPRALSRNVRYQAFMETPFIKCLSSYLYPTVMLFGTIAVLVKGVYPLLNIQPTFISVSAGLVVCGVTGFGALLYMLANTG